MIEPNERATLVSIVGPDEGDQAAEMIARLDAILAVLNEIRDDQRATQRAATGGKAQATVAVGLL